MVQERPSRAGRLSMSLPPAGNSEPRRWPGTICLILIPEARRDSVQLPQSLPLSLSLSHCSEIFRTLRESYFFFISPPPPSLYKYPTESEFRIFNLTFSPRERDSGRDNDVLCRWYLLLPAQMTAKSGEFPRKKSPRLRPPSMSP